ncbi:MAG: hypothetical protein EBZ50_01240 [Alphaproteobacteria bacterium]|nr:hypothetical protein [Alphaproteobacteria bacterium]
MAIVDGGLERVGGRGLCPEPRRRRQLVVVVAATAITKGEERANIPSFYLIVPGGGRGLGAD